MKESIITFVLSKDKYIEVYYPDKDNKDNYHYKPTDQWHKFDVAMITYHSGDQQINLYDDILGAATALADCIIRAKYTLLELPKVIEKGGMTRAFTEDFKDDIDVHGKYSLIDFSKFWVWSSVNGPQTFMYTINGAIYLEIGLTYRWGRVKDEALDEKLYAEFMKNYKPIAVELIPPEVADRWLKQSKPLIAILERTAIEYLDALQASKQK